MPNSFAGPGDLAVDKAPLPPKLPGFEHVRRYRDAATGEAVVKLFPGDFYVTRENEIIDTVLGSCVAACIRNVRTAVGGMNHFMLPKSRGVRLDSWSGGQGYATRYGAASMEQLINRILGIGGTRADLEVKIFGGAQVLSGLTEIGTHNLNFVHEFLREEGLRVAAEDVGDTCPRHVRYQPRTGKVLMRRLGVKQSARIASREERYLDGLEKAPAVGSIDLF